MAQVMVNFRMDEDVKKEMEYACREMGLSMTAAFTIFAKKVGKERRIPFEITAEPYRRQSGARTGYGQGEEMSALVRTQERLELLCTEIRRSLTGIHTAIPAAVTGLTMERIRLLCGDELKDKAAGISRAVRTLFSSRNIETLKEKDLGILDGYESSLASIGLELQNIERALIPAMKAYSGGDAGGFEPYEQQLASVSQKFDALPLVMQRFLGSTACGSAARGVIARIRQAAGPVETACVRTALERLEMRVLRNYDSLEDQVKIHLESDYLQTLELTLRELAWAEQGVGDAGAKTALCLRTVNVLSQVISGNSQVRQEWNDRSLEAEVAALERLAAMRGDLSDGINPEG